MRTILFLAIATSAVLVWADPCAAQPQQWELLQNDPNPFCGETVISFAAPERAEVRLSVSSPDGSEVLRVLVEGVLNAGFYQILWDQRDDDGLLVPDDDYPYQLQAVDPDTGEALFEAWLVATVACDPTAAQVTSWGRIKGGYLARR